MSQKIPIHFGEEDLEYIKELVDLLGISNTYGAIPKALKFSIRLTISSIKNPNKVYATLNDENLDSYFVSVARFEKRARAEEKARNLLLAAKKV